MKRLPPALIFLLTALPLVTRCGSSDASPADRLAVRKGSLDETVVLTGEVEARRGVSIAVPKIPNWETTIKWLAEDGAYVKAGEKVVELDNSAFSSSMDQNRIALTEARQQLAQHEAKSSDDIEEKTFELERTRIALEQARVNSSMPAEILPRREYQDYQLALRRASVENEKARENLESARKAEQADRRNFMIAVETASGEIAVAEKAIADMAINAATDGILIVGDIPWEARKLQTGDRVWVGFRIATIPDLSTLQVVANLWDVDDGKAKVGEPVEVTIDAYPQRQFKGRITSIAPIAQETAGQTLRRAFKTVVTLEQIDPAIMRPGLSAQVVIRRRLADNVLLAPRASIVRSSEGPSLLLASGGQKNVTVGKCNAQLCAVAGIEEGTALRSIAGDQTDD